MLTSRCMKVSSIASNWSLRHSAKPKSKFSPGVYPASQQRYEGNSNRHSQCRKHMWREIFQRWVRYYVHPAPYELVGDQDHVDEPPWRLLEAFKPTYISDAIQRRNKGTVHHLDWHWHDYRWNFGKPYFVFFSILEFYGFCHLLPTYAEVVNAFESTTSPSREGTDFRSTLSRLEQYRIPDPEFKALWWWGVYQHTPMCSKMYAAKLLSTATTGSAITGKILQAAVTWKYSVDHTRLIDNIPSA